MEGIYPGVNRAGQVEALGSDLRCLARRPEGVVAGKSRIKAARRKESENLKRLNI